ncbi:MULTISPECIES: type II toxin-antitoxin system RelE family toxin [unclassified Microcoleus]|uniref:type II toxin-antitoxin system RelE family toxin n=1 Tax=unclassified Microcoleus TaxID=2642155 RepID=UPI002FCF4C64
MPDVWSRSEQTPRLHPNIKALKGDYAGYYRYRIGDCRVIYSIDDEVVQVFVMARSLIAVRRMNREGELVSPATKVINLITKRAIDRSSNWIRRQ